MKQILIVPNRNRLEDCLYLAEKYHLGFEYNDFYLPEVLDNTEKTEEYINVYKQDKMPAFATVHGAFYDVIPFSVDKKIREISQLRIEQSIDVAKMMGAKAVIFHTNYNPFLSSQAYNPFWLESNKLYWEGVLERHPEIDIYLENMFEETPDMLFELSKHLSKYSNYGACFDYAHAAISKTPTEEWAKALGPYVKHVHINDNDLVSDLHLAWGDGKIDRQKFYEIYEKYLNGASVLVETSSMENKRRSLEMLKKDGFIED